MQDLPAACTLLQGCELSSPATLALFRGGGEPGSPQRTPGTLACLAKGWFDSSPSLVLSRSNAFQESQAPASILHPLQRAMAVSLGEDGGKDGHGSYHVWQDFFLRRGWVSFH